MSLYARRRHLMWMGSQMPWWHGCHRTALPPTPTAASTPECLSLRFRFYSYDSFLDKNLLTCLIASFKYLLRLGSFSRFVVWLILGKHSFIDIYCLQHAECVNTSVGRCEAILGRSAVSNNFHVNSQFDIHISRSKSFTMWTLTLSPKPTATLGCLSLRLNF